MIYGLQDFFFLATWWVGYFFTAVQEFFSITFVLHAIFFFRQALAGNFFSKSPTPPPSRVKWSAPNRASVIPYLSNSLPSYLLSLKPLTGPQLSLISQIVCPVISYR